ncbi:MAG: 50S ribosomal protein L11 methyltransferase [Acidobacteriota bacterium]
MSPDADAAWVLCAARLPEGLTEELTASWWAAGALGFEEVALGGGQIELRAWLPAQETEPRLDRAEWSRRGVEFLADRSEPARDWLADYRASSRPFPVGERFVVDPREPDATWEGDGASDGRIPLRLPAQNAFGTGSHESTRLVVRALERLAARGELAGTRVLDVGCGSGILSFAALHLGAARAIGFDLDAPSVVTARANARRNGLEPALAAGRIEAFATRPWVDLALVNVLPERVFADLPRLREMLADDGRVISSGNLVEKRADLLVRLADLGFEEELRDADSPLVEGEWTAFILRRRA